MDSNAPTRALKPTQSTLVGWGMFALVVVVATKLVGPLALMALLVSTGVVLIVSGIRSRGWPRPVMVAVGAFLILLALVPILVLVDFATGSVAVGVK